MNTLTSLSRITIITYVGLFAILDMALLFCKKNEFFNSIFTTIQSVLIVIFLANGSVVLYINTADDRILFLFIGQLLFIAVTTYVVGTIFEDYDRVLHNNVLMLLSFSFIFLERLDMSKAIRQFVFAVISLALMCLLFYLLPRIKWLKKGFWIYLGIGILLLAFVAFCGRVEYGARLSITFGSISIQPAEFVRLSYLFFIASVIFAYKNIKGFFVASIGAAAHVLLLVYSRDLGAALIFLLCYIVMIFIAYRSFILLFVQLGVCFGGGILAFKTFPHIQTRFLAWKDPLSVVENQGYQLSQSLFAIGNGRWIGAGLNQGMPTKIPVVSKDFIFAAISEEMGGLVAVFVMIIIACTFLDIVIDAGYIDDRFFSLILCGIATIFATQNILNIGGVTRFIPSTGVTLSFISYGGSSLLGTFLAFGIVQYAYSNEELKEKIEVKDFSRAGIVGIAYSAVFFMLVLSFGHYINVDSQDFVYNEFNSRYATYSKNVRRGSIVSADGSILAATVCEDDVEYRYYPYAEMFSHAVGYVDDGMAGLEAQYSFDLLKSHTESADQLTDNLSNKKTMGDTLVTTLDFDTQAAAFKGLGNFKGAVIAIEPDTGKVVAMVSKPDFDPNSIDSYWDFITDEENNSSILLNRATQGQYPPGSTFKIITSIAFLRQNDNDTDSFLYKCSGTLKLSDYTIHCSNGKSHGKEDMKKAFSNSCNCAFADMGLKLDVDKFNKSADDLLFNTELPTSLANSKMSKFGLSGADERLIAQTSIGQGNTTVTPLYMCMLVSAVANEGVLMEPYLVDSIRTTDDRVILQNNPVEYGELLSADESNIIQDYMAAVVSDGTAEKVDFGDLMVYGKTGTAEFSKDKDEAHSWFVGYAENKDGKQLAIAVIMERAGYGSKHAAPLAADVFQAFFK